MFQTVLNATQFNSYLQNKQFDNALNFLLNNDIKLSYIDSSSLSCFESISKATFLHFSVPGAKLNSQDISIIEKIIISLLDKEPHYLLQKSFIKQKNIYYFFNFFIHSNNLEKVKFFNENIKKFTNSELEELYIGSNSLTNEMGELIRDSTEKSKITTSEISLAYNSFNSNNKNSKESFLDYINSLIKKKKDRQLTYNHSELTEFCLLLCKNKDFSFIFPKIVELYTPELFKDFKAKSDFENFPNLSKRIDFLCSRIFTCMNFDRVIDKAIDKSIVLPLLSFLQTVNFKDNINDYLIGEFRFKFVPISLEFLEPKGSKDWPSKLGLDKEEGFKISLQYFSNFFVFLLSDSLVSKSIFTTKEDKIFRLTEYKKLYPKQFEIDLLQFEEGIKFLGLKHTFNQDINNIRLYFKLLIAEENNSTSLKIKKSKI